MGVNMLGAGSDSTRGHHGDMQMEVSSMHTHSAPSPSSPCSGQDPFPLEGTTISMDGLGLSQKMYTGYSPEVPTSLGILGTPQMASPLEELQSANSMHFLRMFKDCPSQQHGSTLEPLAPLLSNPVVKQEPPQLGPSEGQLTDGHLPHHGNMQHSWGQSSLLSAMDQQLQGRGTSQPSRLWSNRSMGIGPPVGVGSQWTMDGPLRHQQNGGPSMSQAMSMGSRDRSRDLGMPLTSAPASLTIQITLPRGVDGPVSQTASPATRPSTPSGGWRVDQSGRAVLRTESLPVDFRVGPKFEGATN